MQIGIYGSGRFGSFWASLIAKMSKCDNVVIYSRSTKIELENVKIVSEAECLSSDIIYFCVAISAFEEVLSKVSSIIKKGAIVMDTCSVKVNPSLWMQKYLNKEEYYLIATHPMFGPDSAKNGISNLPIAICEISTKDERYKKIIDIFSSWGLKVLEMTSREHDREAAYSQGVTHFVGRTLKQLGLEDTEIATSGYKSLMSIVDQTCNDPMQLFYDLQRFNPYAKEMRLSLQVALEKILNKLEEQDR